MLLALLALAHAVPVQLHQSGRLLDAAGGPIEGVIDLQVGLYPRASGGAPAWSATLPDVRVEGGHFNVVLGLDGSLDHAVFDAPALWIGFGAEGADLGPRQPLTQVPYAVSVRGGTVHAASIVVDGTLRLGDAPAEACDAEAVGALIYSPVGGLRVCDGTAFRVVGERTLVDVDGARRWSDGTLAPTCEAYRRPAADGYRYDGATGTGLYRIDPDGAGGDAPFVAHCDMVWNEGGWTRIYRQDSRAGFFSEGQTDLNRANPAATNYAILSDLEHFRRDGRFELAMFWPGSSWTAPHRWTQTSNPVTTAAGATPTGCTALQISYTVNGWGCLQRSLSGQSSLLDGTINPQGNWYYAVGTTYCWGNTTTGCQPGPDGGVHVAELWVR